MSVLVTNLTNAVVTIDSVDIPAFGKQLRNRRTAALTTQETAKNVQVDDVDSGPVTLQTEVPLTGTTVTAGDSVEAMVVKPAATIAALTINMPQKPYDGQPFDLMTTQIVTALTMAAASGDTMTGALTAGTANGYAKWRYSQADRVWYRAG